MPEGMACDGHGTLQTDGATQILVGTALSSHEFIYMGNLISFLWYVQLGIRVEISVEIRFCAVSIPLEYCILKTHFTEGNSL